MSEKTSQKPKPAPSAEPSPKPGRNAPRAAGLPTSPAAPVLTAAHARRLRSMWRSAGWPCHDVVEAELLVAVTSSDEVNIIGRIRWFAREM